MNKKAFLLVDSLITVIIVSLMCFLCFNLYNALDKFDEGYSRYQMEMSDYYDRIYSNMGRCEKCEIEIEEEDL